MAGFEIKVMSNWDQLREANIRFDTHQVSGFPGKLVYLENPLPLNVSGENVISLQDLFKRALQN